MTVSRCSLIHPLWSPHHIFLSLGNEKLISTRDYSQPSPTLERDLSSGFPDATPVAKQQGAKQEQNVIVPGREFQVWQQLDCSLGNFAFLASINSVKEAFLACGSLWMLQESSFHYL